MLFDKQKSHTASLPLTPPGILITLTLGSPHSEWESLTWRIRVDDFLVLCTITREIWPTFHFPCLLEHNNIHKALNLIFLKSEAKSKGEEGELGLSVFVGSVCVCVCACWLNFLFPFCCFVLYFGLVGRKSLFEKKENL